MSCSLSVNFEVYEINGVKQITNDGAVLTVMLQNNGRTKIENFSITIITEEGVFQETLAQELPVGTIKRYTHPHGLGNDLTNIRIAPRIKQGGTFVECTNIFVETDQFRTITETIGLDQHTLTVNIDGNGTVISIPGTINCPGKCSDDFNENTEVTLTAQAGEDYEFTGWSGACSGEQPTCVVNMTEAKTVTAEFNEEWACGHDFIDERDGQTYSTVQIGAQCWFVENLNVGDMVSGGSPQGTDCSNIRKWCWGNNENNCDIRGALYLWNMAMCGENSIGAQGICPNGWHIPSDEDFKELEIELGMVSGVHSTGMRNSGNVGFKLKAEPPFWDGNNESGLAVLQTGDYWNGFGGCSGDVCSLTRFWSSTDESGIWSRYLATGDVGVGRHKYGPTLGKSIRCLMD